MMNKLIIINRGFKMQSVLAPLISMSNMALSNLSPTIRSTSSASYNYNDPDKWYIKRIGNREVVTFGVNGEPEYVDRLDYPFPAIRYKPPTSEFLALRGKERGDWRLLSVQEKKAIYRANFCQTYTEMTAPTGKWMYTLGWTLILTSAGLWLFILEKQYVYSQCPTPASFTEDSQREQLKRMIVGSVNPVTGIASFWDYENMKWKRQPWYIPWKDPFAEQGDLACAEDLL